MITLKCLQFLEHNFFNDIEKKVMQGSGKGFYVALMKPNLLQGTIGERLIKIRFDKS